MFKNESRKDIKILYKYLSKTEFQFLSRLDYWASHKKGYGVERDNRVWIYNALEDWAEQLGFSKSSVRRAIKSLKDKNLIFSDYLSPNKRNRTLYYSINHDGVGEYLSEFNRSTCAQKPVASEHTNEHMDEYFYNSKQNINKSNKSKKIIDEKEIRSLDPKPQISQMPTKKPTIVQDMVKIFNAEFPKTNCQLTRQLAKYLVAAFKTKFHDSLDEWKRYLKLIKTSSYIISEKFKLSISWLIKFFTIDRIRAGELGVDSKKIQVDASEFEEKALEHISIVQEPDVCKRLRAKISQILSPAVYLSWFTKVELVENHQKISMKTTNDFVKDYLERNFMDILGMEFA